MPKTLQQQWNDFLQRVYPAGIAGEQRKQVYNAFMAGAFCVACTIEQIAALEDEALAVEQIAALHAEARTAVQHIVSAIKARN
jgi:hypothetical protein